MQTFAFQIVVITIWRKDTLVIAVFAGATLDIAIQQL